MLDNINSIVQKLDNTIDNINCGGCCVFAESLFPYMTELGLTPKIKLLDHCWNDNRGLSEIRQNVDDNLSYSDWCRNGVAFAHIVIEFKYYDELYIVDSTGVVLACDFDAKNCTIRDGAFSYEEARSFSEESNGWNPWFSRSDIKKIKKGLNSGFKKAFSIDSVHDESYC